MAGGPRRKLVADESEVAQAQRKRVPDGRHADEMG